MLEQPAPAGCAAGGRGVDCPNGKGLALMNYWLESVSYGGTALNPYSGATYHYPAGRYDVYLLTEPGRHLTVTWRTGQASRGTSTASRAQHIRTSYQHESVPGNVLTAMTSGAVEQRLTHQGMLFDYVWASNEPES